MNWDTKEALSLLKHYNHLYVAAQATKENEQLTLLIQKSMTIMGLSHGHLYIGSVDFDALKRELSPVETSTYDDDMPF